MTRCCETEFHISHSRLCNPATTAICHARLPDTRGARQTASKTTSYVTSDAKARIRTAGSVAYQYSLVSTTVIWRAEMEAL